MVVKHMKKVIILLILSLICNVISAQKHDVPETDFYQLKSNIYDRHYSNYEMQHLRHKYELKAQNIMTAGYGVMLLMATAVTIPAVLYDWSLWVVIPCETVVLTGTVLGFVLWSQSLKKKARQINVAKVYEYNINENYSMSICNHYDAITQRCTPGLGLNITF